MEEAAETHLLESRAGQRVVCESVAAAASGVHTVDMPLVAAQSLHCNVALAHSRYNMLTVGYMDSASMRPTVSILYVE
jgi:hypothetical protein